MIIPREESLRQFEKSKTKLILLILPEEKLIS